MKQILPFSPPSVETVVKMLGITDKIEDVKRHGDDVQLVRQYERRQLKLGKRLAYLLRYGAEKEGLRVDEGEFRCNRW